MLWTLRMSLLVPLTAMAAVMLVKPTISAMDPLLDTFLVLTTMGILHATAHILRRLAMRKSWLVEVRLQTVAWATALVAAWGTVTGDPAQWHWALDCACVTAIAATGIACDRVLRENAARVRGTRREP